MTIWQSYAQIRVAKAYIRDFAEVDMSFVVF